MFTQCQSFDLKANDVIRVKGQFRTVEHVRRYRSKRDGNRVYIRLIGGDRTSLPYYRRMVRVTAR